MSSKAFIDWLSFTIDKPTMSRSDMLANLRDALLAHPFLEQVCDASCGDTAWEWSHGRAPYSLGWRRVGVTIFDGVNSNHMLVELSGQFFTNLPKEHHAPLLEMFGRRASRVDVAYDIVIGETPSQVMERIGQSRIKARAVITSKTGETAYIGSRKSDQLVRIYQYNEPHPRAGITRIEYQARRKIAKVVIQAILDDGIDSVYERTCDTFKLPQICRLGATASEYRLERADRHASKTLMWIIGTCVPAIHKLADAGVIDLDDFIAEYLKPNPPPDCL